MTAASIGAAKGGGYARYLESKTVEPERGDYYLTPDGELTQAPGRWLADTETLARLGVQVGAPVDGRDFIALMEGRHPKTGQWLRPEGGAGGRGGGIDVTLSAPKSVSTVWALGDPWQREQIERAHGRAVEQTVHHLREQVPVVRRRYGGPAIEEHAKDVIATEYRHTTARGVSGAQAPDPQLHSHVVITGAVREDDRIVAVASRPIFRNARELGAFYRSALAEELVREGYAIEQGTGKDGRYFEIKDVPRELCVAFSGRSREVAGAAERFRARYGRAPERGELRNLALENRHAKTLTTRSDLQRVWTQTGHDHGFGPDEAVQLIGASERPAAERAIEDRVEAKLTEQHAVFVERDLRAVVLEQAAGELAPDQALAVAREMVRDRRILTLEGGRMTTLAVRAQEQAIERRAAQLAQPTGRDVGGVAREHAAREVAERIGGQLSPEQHHALEVLTGPERAAVLVGPAGTGKGVVIDTVARAEQHAGHGTVGVAVSGSTAERLGADSPALAGQTLTLDSLVARANTGTIYIGRDTTVILDEAGMVDHKRLDALTELVGRSGAKLIAVGDGKQLPSIGPGGMFDRLTNHAPTAELADIHRTKDPADQRAWQALRAGEPERAMAHYASRGQLHLSDTRDQAAEQAVQTWATLTEGRDIREVALIADASNQEIDRLNARAQHLRTQRGELGHHEIPLPSVHYGLREGDLIAFSALHRQPGQPRVENGTRGLVSAIRDRDVTITLDGSQRRVKLAGEDLESLRLAYAQHEDFKGAVGRIHSGSLDLPNGYFEHDGAFGKSLVASIPGVSLKKLYVEHGNRLFDQNVRLFLGTRKGSVNAGIRDTLEDTTERKNFWAYNNGIMIVTSSFTLRQDDRQLEMTEFSVVNGCQTTVSIGEASDAAASEVSVLTRIVAANPNLVDSIIRFTNSQTPIKLWDLSARDSLQKRLQQELAELSNPWFYALRRGELETLPNKNDFGPYGRRRLLEFPLAAQFVAAMRGLPVEAYRDKARLFTTHKDKVFPNDTTGSDVLWAWSIGQAVERAVKKYKEDLEPDETVATILRRGARFFVVAVCAHLLRLRNGDDVFAKVDAGRVLDKAMANRLDKYALLAVSYYVGIMRSLIEGGSELGILLRNSDTSALLEQRVKERLFEQQLAPKALDEALPKLPEIKR